MVKQSGNQQKSVKNKTDLPQNKTSYLKVRRKILTYYLKNGRELPWRKTTNPYHIMVSEFMLQQTQVSRVIEYYTKFIKRLPTIEALAKVKSSVLLKLWSGLGYNSRALRLRTAAQEIIRKHDGKFPQVAAALRELPGIGEYTSAAILAFAFNKAVPVIDINIRRVLLSELQMDNSVSNEELKLIAKRMIPQGKSAVWHNALMDYGASLAPAIKKLYPPLTKRSSFKGSKREARGYILRILLKEKEIREHDLLRMISHRGKNEILTQLEAENFIIVKKGIVRLK
ncbi:MAG: hypothetical protein AMXMBFR48_12560 [Ignavibacteriales bacterium]